MVLKDSRAIRPRSAVLVLVGVALVAMVGYAFGSAGHEPLSGASTLALLGLLLVAAGSLVRR